MNTQASSEATIEVIVGDSEVRSMERHRLRDAVQKVRAGQAAAGTNIRPIRVTEDLLLTGRLVMKLFRSTRRTIYPEASLLVAEASGTAEDQTRDLSRQLSLFRRGGF
jgi:hypothetical protein